MPKENWPNFFIVGAAKSATTSLYEYLKQVPGICMSTIKEPHYFAPNVVSNPFFYVCRDKDDYLSLFREAKSKAAVGEASPSYLWDKDSPRIIHEFVPNARIIIILRNPLQRTFSHYLMNVRNGSETLPFCEALERDYSLPNKGWGLSNLYVELSLYSEQVKRYLDKFGKERVKILLFEEFIKDTKFAVKDVLRFLDIEEPVPNNVNKSYKSNNSFFSPRYRTSIRITNLLMRSFSSHMTLYKIAQSIPISFREKIMQTFLLQKTIKPKMSDDARTFLEEICFEDMNKLSSIVERPLHWSFAPFNRQ